ncbi:MAG: tetratricopeptide repeat protein [Pleurocapsa minor HA4230-MV1]|jgi:tetratricopeptide (TPR) repeat protein/capsular polysaccharide biosynthesis protein|nr:tetratricopeptide repeat protein [Pleurocapsa minor HA4230-MV1]
MIRGESSFKKIKIHLGRGEWEQVIEICQQAIATDPDGIDFYPYLARAYAQQGKFAPAISAYRKTLGTRINQAEIYAELGLLHSKQQDPRQAVWHYKQALKLQPYWAELQYNLAVVLHQMGNWQEAIAAYNQTIKINPDYEAAYFNLGVLYDQKGELDAAIAAYQQVITIQPDLVQAYSNLGSTYARQQEYSKAIATLRKGIALDPTWVTLHNNLGQVYWFNSQPELALTSFETAIILSPKMALAHHNLGRLWQQQGNYAEASRCFQHVLQLEPQNVLAHSSYAEVQQKMGNLASTLESWQRIIELEPDFVNAYCQGKLTSSPEDLLEIAKLACARLLQALKSGQQEEAYHHLWRTYGYMGDVLFEFGGIKQAESYYQRALQLQPEDIELYLKLGNCLARQRRLNAAVIVYHQGLALQPNQPQICFQLGKVLEKTQQAEQAINYYERVLSDRQQDDWKQLPKLFPTEDNLASLPTQIYHHTQDWVRDSNLKDFDYVQVLWSQAPVVQNKTKIVRQPEAIKIKPGDTSYPDCGGVNCNSCMTKLIAQFKPLQIGQNAYQCSLEQAPKIDSGLPFVVTIPNGRAWVAPQKNSWVICYAMAVITPDNYLLGDLSRNYPWFLPGCPYQERAEHSIFEQENIAPVEKITGRVALLSSLAGHVYYHWMFDILPRLELLRRSELKFKEIDWFVVNSLSKPYQQETLDLMGIAQDKIIESDRHSHIQASELIVPSFPGYLDWVPEGTIKFLRETFLPQINSNQNNQNYSKIYVSRARAKNRRLVNEIEVSQLLTKLGFVTVFLEEMSFLEQVKTFASAKMIVSPHGSGLTNLVFCSPHTQVVELFSPNYIRTDYWMISQQLDLQHYYIVGQNFSCSSLRNLMYQNALTEDIFVSIDALKLVLQHC